MQLSPEEQYHQNIINDDKIEEDYPSKAKPMPMSIPRPASQKKPYVKYKILMKQNSQLNKKIINYFKQNLSILNKNLFVFEWIVVYDEELEHYEEQNIDKFPALVGRSIIMGVSNIIQALDTLVSNTQVPVKRSSPQSKKETAEEMHDFLLNELKSKDAEKDDDDQDNISNTISQRVSSMNKSRADNGLHAMGKPSAVAESDSDDDIFTKTPTLSMAKKTPTKASAPTKALTTSELIQATTKGDDEDKMMSQFWQNQEETEM